MNKTPNEQSQKKVLGQVAARFEPFAGTHIDNACKEALAIAIKLGHDVKFDFNGIRVVATPKDGWRDVVKRWSDADNKRREDYHNSPEGKAAAEQRKLDILNKQLLVDTSIAVLPMRLGHGDLDSIMDWIGEFTSPSDDIGVKFDHKLVADLFEAHGYKNNEHVGQKPEWFNNRERMGRYIIGQAINCLRSGMSPHGITYNFIEKYRKLSLKSNTATSADSASTISEEQTSSNKTLTAQANHHTKRMKGNPL